MSGTEIYKTPCPSCGGRVSQFWWGSDCRGNSGGCDPITCNKCKRTFNDRRWSKIAAKEIAKKAKERSESFKRYLEMWKRGKTPESIAFVEEARAYLKEHEHNCELLRNAIGEIYREEWVLTTRLSLKEGLKEKMRRNKDREERKR